MSRTASSGLPGSSASVSAPSCASWRQPKPPSALKNGLLFPFPALAGQQNVARYFMLTTRVIGDLPTRDPERLGCIVQAQAVLPAPTNELHGIGPPALFERHLPESLRADIDLARPYDTMATLADAGTREHRSIPEWAQALEPGNWLAKVNGKLLIVRPLQAQRVIARGATTWKCGGGWSPKYIAMRHRANLFTVGIAYSSAWRALVQTVHYVTQILPAVYLRCAR
jgi:hypothetical protein